jgi:CheY-like chemotaxis protein
MSVSDILERATPRALVVDTCVDSRNLARAVLRLVGFQADVVASDIDAIELFATQGYALVLLDGESSSPRAFDLTRTLRRCEQTLRRAPAAIVVVSAVPSPSEARRLLRAGAVALLPKPIRLARVRAEVGRWLALARQINGE